MSVLDEAEDSLTRIQDFDVNSLMREKELGTAKNFESAIAPGQRLIDLYNRLSPRALQDFPDAKLVEVRSRANADYNIFEQILSFDVDRTTADRDKLVNTLTSVYNEAFNVLHPLVSYSLHRSADFQTLESEARATIQGIRDGVADVVGQLEDSRNEAQRILEEVRKTAAETGVSQQAVYFRDAADDHDSKADAWRKKTSTLAWGLGVFAAASFFIHKLPVLAPSSTYDTVQIAVSKLLIFAVISYMLYLSARNFLSHKHNAIVNRHRQHALLTYKALVDAAGESATTDIVLTHAAACIFSPQPTGYSGDDKGQAPSARSVVELMGGPITSGN